MVYAVVRILERYQAPVLRRFLEATLVHVGGFQPATVRKVLDDLRRFVPEAIVQELLVDDDAPDDEKMKSEHIYGLRPATNLEREALKKLVAERQAILPSSALGAVGERFVRACLIRSGRYTRISQEAMLGYRTAAPGIRRMDLKATAKADGTRYALSVKNRRKVLEPRSNWIAEAIKIADAHDRMPWLFVSFATDAARRSCEAQGVRLNIIGSRVAGAEDYRKRPMPLVLRELYPVLGGEPFTFMGAQRLVNPNEPLIEALLQQGN